MNKLIIILVFLLLSTFSLVNASGAFVGNLTTGVSVEDLNFWYRVNCLGRAYQDNLLLCNESAGAINTGNVGFISAVLSYVGAEGLLIGNNRVEYCNNLVANNEYVTSSNNETQKALNDSATAVTQAALEDVAFNSEKENALVNINSAWDYVKLLFFIIIDVLMIIYYVLQFYLVVWVLLIAFPKAFLKIRDGVTMFIVKRHRKRYESDGGGNQ
jgi:hypothetical protein